MMSFLDLKISAFRNARATDPVPVSIRAFLNTAKYHATIDKVRATVDKKERDDLKKQLPAATLSGTFSKRLVENVTSYNGIVCIDIDASDNPDTSAAEMKNRLSTFEQVAYASLSVGGKGVFALVLTDLKDYQYHPRFCGLLEGYFKEYALLNIDRACKDITRLRFVSYDTNAYINESAIPFETAQIVQRWQDADKQKKAAPPRAVYVPDHPSPGSTTLEKVEHAVSFIERSMVAITDYVQWTNIGFALYSEFQQGGYEFFKRISMLSTPNKQKEFEGKWKQIASTSQNRVKIGSFFSHH